MASGKIVRITDETFQKLQNLAEPFIDTPSSVIERLLDYYESRLHVSRQSINAKTTKKITEKVQNLYLAPASKENLEKTINNAVRFDGIKQFLSAKEKSSLSDLVPSLNKLNCWAMTESNRSIFEKMKMGDKILFKPTGTGFFTYYGEVYWKTENMELSKSLWNFIPNNPWKLIYFLKNIQRINIESRVLITSLGYKPNYVVQGVIRVSDLRRDTILQRYSSWDSFIGTLAD